MFASRRAMVIAAVTLLTCFSGCNRPDRNSSECFVDVSTLSDFELLPRLEAEWKSRVAKGSSKNTTVFLLLKGCSEPDSVPRFVCALHDVEPSEFTRQVVTALITICCQHKYDATLVELLSRHCPASVSSADIEWALVRLRGEVEGIELLCEAYAIAKGDAKEQIILALRRAFPSLISETDDQDAFVAKCKQWPVEHAGKYMVNPRYFQGVGVLRDVDGKLVPTDLFIDKNHTMQAVP